MGGGNILKIFTNYCKINLGYVKKGTNEVNDK